MMDGRNALPVFVGFAVLFILIIVGFSAFTSGTGPAYQGPGIEIDVDGNKKYKPGYKTWPNYKAPSFKKR